MQAETKTSCRKRLNRVEGQVRGLIRMIDDDRYCIDIITQIAAARAALKRVEEELLRKYLHRCVAQAIQAGDNFNQQQKIDEMMNLLGKMV